MEFFCLSTLGPVAALIFATYLAMSILKHSSGDDKMVQIQSYILKGANTFMRRQYTTVAIFFFITFCVLVLLVRGGYLPLFVPASFLTGGAYSALAGFIGMKIATASNARTANAAREKLSKGLSVAFSSGAIMGLTVVGLALLDLNTWYRLLSWYYTSVEPIADEAMRLKHITATLIGSGMGASSMALFGRVGGGIFTKAADVGADLVGKVEAGIPEDDPRNPAVIADNVGDNVGDIAGMGADLYESYVGSIVATMVLAVASGFGLKGVMAPLILASLGVISAIIGTFFVKSDENATQSSLLLALRKGIIISALLVGVFSFFITKFILGHMGIYICILIGLASGVVIGLATEYFTSENDKPAQRVAESATTGPATVIISGISVGMMSCIVPVVTIVIAILTSFYIAGGGANHSLGLYGIGMAAVGMLSTLGMTLATDAYGPVADNAGGIAEMSGQDPEVRKRTDALDSLGNTTAATGKGFAIGSAALTALALIAAYRSNVEGLGIELNLSLMNPRLIAGLFLGGMLPMFFCALTMDAVGRAASKIVVEVRRQFREITGLMEGTAEADYKTCVDICTKSALKEMIFPSCVAILAPLAIGLILNVDALIGLLMGALVSGFVIAIMMANAGGVWDNAKKYIESGAVGGKGTDAHKASVVGDTVGDPFKDTSGPSINILVKLMSMVSLIFVAFIAKHAIFF